MPDLRFPKTAARELQSLKRPLLPVRRLWRWLRRPMPEEPTPQPETAAPVGHATILDSYVMSMPCPQTALDIFKGAWSSEFPEKTWQAGQVRLFDDCRIQWGIAQLGGVMGKQILELGPLEGGHTYQLEKLGAASVLAIDANTRAYLKCLITKELLGLRRCRFLCGDFVEYLRHTPDRFDVGVAVGVLYHMRNPVELLGLLAAKTDRLLIWTHYYDPKVISTAAHLLPKFPSARPAEYDGFRHTQYRYEYQQALQWGGFCGGGAEYSHWLSRDDLFGALRHYGFSDLRLQFEEPHHPNGPCLTIAALRP